MFVPYKPELCFDVYRPNDRCVCGASAIVTYSEGINNGYCATCAKKRKEFIDKVIGNIEVKEKDNNILINTLEQMRKNILQERFCYMIDQYFVSHENEPFSEPYENLSFIEKIYREKRCLMHDFILPAFTAYISSNTNDNKINKKIKNIEKQYNYYYKKLCEMYDVDGEKLEEAMYLQTGVHTLAYSLTHSKGK